VNPEELLYTKTHEWVHLADQSGEKLATVGLSAFAVEALTDLVFIELPDVGRHVDVSEAFGEIESVKAVSDLYSPVRGEIVEVNSGLPDALETLSNDPYDAGWIIKIKLADDTGVDLLMDHSAYQQLCAEEDVD
jgi:glycine cleavage system H protein